MEKITCPSKRQYSKRIGEDISLRNTCGRTVMFIPLAGDFHEIILPPCKSCGSVIGVSRSDGDITIHEHDRNLKIEYTQSVRKISNG